MINLSELRRGNKVASPTHNLLNATVQGFTPIGIVFLREVSTYDISDKINPIPLTPEVLEKCGFVKQRKIRGVGVDYYENIITIIVETGGYITLNGFGVEVKHLHQLQNIYYSLTGTELEINL